MAASPLLLGTDLAALNATDKAMLTNDRVLAVDQDGVAARGRPASSGPGRRRPDESFGRAAGGGCRRSGLGWRGSPSPRSGLPSGAQLVYWESELIPRESLTPGAPGTAMQ
ncbi:hypothetical protein [Streptomyces sp. HUAS TT7]|uniref:hypothetical protein n=1 Tax=Streptomyces sp. HUAS TT7 TaxID=3447507 RepID=UPI003F65FBB3